MAAVEDPACKTLLSVPRCLLQKIFTYNFPVNMLRAVGTCNILCTTLAMELKAAVRFRKTEWVIVGECEAADFNNRVGQIIGVKPDNCRRCAVQVDGLSSGSQNQIRKPSNSLGRAIWSEFVGLTREVGSRMVGLSRFKLYAFRASSRGMLAAVRLAANGEVSPGGPLEGKCEKIDAQFSVFASETKIPWGLAMFGQQQGQSPLMADLGRPILLRQVVPLCDLQKQFGWNCYAASQLRSDPATVGSALEWSYDAGPTVVAWLDQTDFTLDDFRQVWRLNRKAVDFHDFHEDSDPRPSLSALELETMWFESATKQEPVFETVFHDEAPATIKPDEARNLVETQHESTILHQPVPSGAALACFITFHRTPEALDRALERSDLGQRLRAVGQTLKPRWAGGAKILVEGLTEAAWTRGCQDAGLALHLRPGDVILPADALPKILAEVQKIPRPNRPRLKAGKEMISIPDLSRFADVSENSATLMESASSQDSLESSGWTAFIHGLRDKIQHVPFPQGYTSRTFIQEPEDAPVTPRSMPATV